MTDMDLSTLRNPSQEPSLNKLNNVVQFDQSPPELRRLNVQPVAITDMVFEHVSTDNNGFITGIHDPKTLSGKFEFIVTNTGELPYLKLDYSEAEFFWATGDRGDVTIADIGSGTINLLRRKNSESVIASFETSPDDTSLNPFFLLLHILSITRIDTLTLQGGDWAAIEDGPGRIKLPPFGFKVKLTTPTGQEEQFRVTEGEIDTGTITFENP